MNKLKKLMEKRAALLAQLSEMLAQLDNGEETRAFTAEELAEYNKKKDEAEKLSATIAALQEQRSVVGFVPADGTVDAEQRALSEERAFEKFLRSGGAAQMETRSDTNWTTTANGAVIPATIANKIVDKVKEISPLFSLASHYDVGANTMFAKLPQKPDTMSGNQGQQQALSAFPTMTNPPPRFLRAMQMSSASLRVLRGSSRALR